MTTLVHPVADEATSQWLVYDTRTNPVILTEPLRVFLNIATTDQLHPILVTNPDAHLSPALASVLAETGGSWVARTHQAGRPCPQTTSRR